MKRKSTSRIPPDLDSLKLHVARVNYQTHIYLAFDKPDAPHSQLAMAGHCKMACVCHCATQKRLCQEAYMHHSIGSFRNYQLTSVTQDSRVTITQTSVTKTNLIKLLQL